jgi:cell division initiation protein
VTLDMDKLSQENKALKDTILGLNAEIERYRGSEGTIFKTLESAKALMSDISSSAEKRAEIVLKNAELDAERLRREARESVERITEESVAMAGRWEQFKFRYKNLLQNELDRFESLSADLLIDSDAERIGFYTDTVSPAAGNKADDRRGKPPGDITNKTIKTSKRNGF